MPTGTVLEMEIQREHRSAVTEGSGDNGHFARRYDPLSSLARINAVTVVAAAATA